VQYKLPIVFVVNNNSGIVGAGFQSRMEVAPGFEGYISTYDPGFRYDLIGAAFGAYTENVTDPEEIAGAMERAYEATNQGRTAVVHVVSDPQDLGTMRATGGRASSLLGY
jgi:thiamine pyrophosphate-dependent acetolactate synthase large subunit-like protein